jgi:putative hydroxymethylpyrimidine transport system ATP-binding protein
MGGPTIHLDNVSLRFGNGKTLFSGLSFTADSGKCTCVLGPSGCGKSTLLRLVSGSDDFTIDGSITFSPQPEASDYCAWMGQNDLLLPWMSLLDNVLLGFKLRGELTDELREKAVSLLADANLQGYEKALPNSLSGGMRQRGALLRTLMEDRPILLMDEPFSALDSLTRLKLQDLSASMTRGSTVLLVTHDVMEALRMAHRIIVLDGSPARIKADIHLQGDPPRAPEDPEVLGHYGPLLAELMEEG